MKKSKFDVGECSRSVDDEMGSSEVVMDDPILEPNNKIFLSHSGFQKEFVVHLCKALEAHCRYPFFDKRPDKLPKGKKFAGLILEATEQCQLLVVVVSEEYFMSKWPMIELNAFVQAKKEMKSNGNVDILPLFYGLSMSEMTDETRQQRWLNKWETFAADDVQERINVEDWKYAFNELLKFNGLSYARELQQIEQYEKDIVSLVCGLVAPDIKWDDTEVQGNAHEVILEKMSHIQRSRKYNVKVFGIYGVGGIGKTIACERMCNALSSEYEGRVCHVEFESKCPNSKELLQEVSMTLTKKSSKVVEHLNEGECKNVLRKHLRKFKTFLALDNIWDDDNSIKQAKVYLTFGFHPESVVFVTARSLKLLELLGIDGGACIEMPEIGREDATNLFLYHAAEGKPFSSKEDRNCIAQCVARCYFRKGNGEGFHYHPLALEVLGRQLGCRGENPSEWVHNLGVSSKETVVFDVLRTSFDLLDAREQALFMDVGFFFNPVPSYHRLYDRKGGLLGFRDELLPLYKGNEGDLQNRLDNLRRKGLLQAADLSSGRISMHDLYREFAELEAKGKFGDGADMASRKWVYVGLDWGGDLSELEITPAGGCWSKLTRLWIRDYWYSRPDHAESITSLEGIEWHHFPNVSMLHIHGLNHVLGTLNLKGMKQLRFLRLNGLDSLRRIEDLSVLTNLSYLECTIRFVFMATCSVGQFPASLKNLSIAGPSVFLSRNAVARCVKLCKLVLDEVRAGGEQLDLTNCSSLESVTLRYLGDVQILLLPASKGAPKLRILKIRSRFANVVHVQGLEQSVGLEQLYLDGWCRSKEVPCLLALTRLQILRIDEVGTHFELRIPRQIQELYLKRSGFIEVPSLHGFEQLQVLHFSGSEDLTGMSGMGDLPALRRLRLFNCRRLQQLPDLRKSSNLEQLDLEGCSELKLLEDDIQMLAALPSLHPVVFSPSACIRRFRVDLVRRKVLQHPGKQGPKSWLGWKEGEWAEHELGLPPVGIVTELEEWRALSADPDVVENDGTVERFFLDLLHRFDQ